MSNDVNMQRAIFASLQVAHETFVNRFVVDVVQAWTYVWCAVWHELNVTEVIPLFVCVCVTCCHGSRRRSGALPLEPWHAILVLHTRAKPPNMRTPRRGPELSPGASAAPGSRLSAAVFEHICARSVPQRARTRAGARGSCKANSDGAAF